VVSSRLAAEGEGLEMNGEKIIRTGVVGHLHGPVGCAMVLNPGLIRADGHDGQFQTGLCRAMTGTNWSRLCRRRK